MNRSVTLGRGGLVLSGQGERLVLSGEAHYWRLDRDMWGVVLDRIAELGFTTVSTYVPWCEHEPQPGRFDTRDHKDVVAFLREAQARGLMAMVRIGPDSGAEQETSGWPGWLVEDPEVQARRPSGQPYLLVSATGFVFPPSYASTTFLAAARRWYEHIVPLLAPLQWPHGPIVACQLDNELGYHFQANTYALDHHPDAIEQYRRFLADGWDGIAALNEAYGTTYADFASVEPPTDAADFTLRCRTDWIAWREAHRRDTLTRLAGWARDLGMDRVPLVHNDYPRTDTPMELGALEAEGSVDWAAADIYAGRQGGRFVRDLAQRLAGSSRLPFMAELGAGWLTLPWLLPLEATVADQEIIALRTFLSGAKAANVFMLVERDRWYGSPIDTSGELRPGAALWPRLRSLLDRIGWTDLRRHRRVLLLDNRAEQRRRASFDTFGELVPCFQQLLPLDHRLTRVPDERGATLTSWEQELSAALDVAGVDADRATTASLPPLDGYDLVAVPCLGDLERPAWDALEAAAAAGTRVVIGPHLPDGVEHPPPGITRIAAADELVDLLPAPPARRDHPHLDLHWWDSDDRTVLAAFNSSGQDLTATVAFGDGDADAHVPIRLRGLWHDETLTGEGGVTVQLAPWGAQVWEVER